MSTRLTGRCRARFLLRHREIPVDTSRINRTNVEESLSSSIPNPAMNQLAIFALCLCLLCAGCVDHQGSGNKSSTKVETLSVAITSPESGAIITGDKDISFESAV